MAHRATLVSQDPLNYFLQPNDVGPYIRVSDVVLRVNLNPKDVFSGIIRFATNSAWSHTALLYLISDPLQGYDNTFLVEAMTSTPSLKWLPCTPNASPSAISLLFLKLLLLPIRRLISSGNGMSRMQTLRPSSASFAAAWCNIASSLRCAAASSTTSLFPNIAQRP